jgi:hypothetical protein
MDKPTKPHYQFDPERFENAVVELRKHQKAYYDSTKYTQASLKHLQEAKKWEKTVDMLLLFRDQKPPKAE